MKSKHAPAIALAASLATAGLAGLMAADRRQPPWEKDRSKIGQALYRARTAIERSFGSATCFGGGLGPLPAWVRGQARVRTWVWAKLLINAVRIRARSG